VLFSGRAASFNLRAAFLEVVNDALGSVNVIVAAIVIAITGWQGADAIAAILIGTLILPRAVKLLRVTTGVLVESTPAGPDLDALRSHLLALPYVRDVHDLHATQVATGLPCCRQSGIYPWGVYLGLARRHAPLGEAREWQRERICGSGRIGTDCSAGLVLLRPASFQTGCHRRGCAGSDDHGQGWL